MDHQIYFGGYFEVETSHGSEIVPDDVIGRTVGTAGEAFANYVEGEILAPEDCLEHKTGWLARLSMPGFLDCTSWTAHSSEEEARQSLIDTYGDEE